MKLYLHCTNQRVSTDGNGDTVVINRYYEDLLGGIPGISATETTLLENSDYRNFTNNLLQKLASLPESEDAFTKINKNSIDPHDSQFVDKIIDVKNLLHPQIPNSSNVLYVDDTLDGRGDNRYFYRVLTTDDIGNIGPFSESTLPVSIPKTTPPITPTFTKILSEDRKTILKWSGLNVENIIGFNIFRTSDFNRAKDIRNMEIIKKNENDIFSINVTNPLPTEFEYVDEEVELSKTYHYRIVSIDTSNIHSKSSDIISGNGIELTPPNPPQWINMVRSTDKTNITLNWACEEPLKCIIQRQTKGKTILKNIADWTDPIIFNSNNNWWEYQIKDVDLEPFLEYQYKILGLSHSGIKVISTFRTTGP